MLDAVKYCQHNKMHLKEIKKGLYKRIIIEYTGFV